MIYPIRPFRFYCQKVLPLVYDESLSYYELLCKVVDYLNMVIENTNTVIDEMSTLEQYVTDYFNSTDFSDKIDAKLDEMVEDGTFAHILNDELLGALNDRIVSLEHCVNPGNGTLVFDVENMTDMTFATYSSYVDRTKMNNSISILLHMTNNTGSTIDARTKLVKLPNADLGILGGRLILHLTAMIVDLEEHIIDDFAIASLERDSNGDVYITVSKAIRDAKAVYISGYSNVEPANSKMFNRGLFNRNLADSICHTFLYGTISNHWLPGAFTYSNNNNTRLDPTQRATDCSGMTYLAYSAFGIHPHGSTVVPYYNGGMLIAYADINKNLDVSMALPGDIIIYQNGGDLGDPDTYTHCSLYAGNDVTYEMAAHYPDAEHTAGAQDGYGPYQITTPASQYRKDNRRRFIVRYL